MAKVLATSVRVVSEGGAHVVLEAGVTPPEWALSQITNEAAFVEDETPTDLPVLPEESPALGRDDATAGDYQDMKVAELRSLIEDRNADRAEDEQIPVSGTKAALIEALEADDQANA